MKLHQLFEEDNPLRTYYYFVNLDERGEFAADVRDENDKTVWETKGNEVFEDGFMKNKNDLVGLKEYLVQLGIMNPSDKLLSSN